MLGSAVTLVIVVIYYLLRRVLSFKEITDCIPEGFKSMVPAILILTFAWTLKSMTGALGSDVFVEGFVQGFADNSALMSLIPAIAAVVTFFLTEDMTQPMQMTDKWTLLMAVYLVANVIMAIIAHKTKDEDDQNNQNA